MSGTGHPSTPPAWAWAAGGVLVAALASVSWQLIRSGDAETKAELARMSADHKALSSRLDTVERDLARRGAQLDGIDKTLTRIDSRLDKIDAHLEGLVTAAAAPRKGTP